MISCRRALLKLKSEKTWNVPDGLLLLSTYSEVAFAGLGKYGVYLADFSVAGSLLGICCACQINIATLLHGLPFVNVSVSTLTVISALIVYPISCAKDLSALSAFQFIGIICILFNVAAFLIYGYILYIKAPDNDYLPSLLPESRSNVSGYFGVVVFCYGVCTYIFPVEENMENSKDFNRALLYCLVLVSLFYIIVGEIASLLYNETTQGHISGNILLNLPNDSIATCIARISMTGVCLLTYPLTLLPPVTMTENFIEYYSRQTQVNSNSTSTAMATASTPLLSANNKNQPTLRKNYSDVGDESLMGISRHEAKSSTTNTTESANTTPLSWHIKAVVRLVFCMLTTACAAYIPCFSFVRIFNFIIDMININIYIIT